MADQGDVRRIALALPGTSAEHGRFAFSVLNKGKQKGFAWVWMERVAPKRPRVPNPDVVALRVADQEEKELLLAADPAKFFTEPHYNGFPAVLVRLPAIGVDELEGLIVEAWRCQAPRSLVSDLPRNVKGSDGMAEDRDALLEHYRSMRAELLAAIDGLSDELMSEQSIDGWSVKDHLGHLALWDEIRASEVVRISAGHGSAWRMTGEQDGVYSGLGHALRQGLPAEQIKWELTTTHRRLLDAISSATARGLDGSLYGEAGLRSTHEGAHTGWIKRWRGEKGV